MPQRQEAGAQRLPWQARGGSRLGAGRAFRDLPQQGADRDGFTVLGRDLAQRACGRRRDFNRDLVGFEFNQRFIDRNGVAGLLEPAADGGLGHGFAERRNANFSHGVFLFASWPDFFRAIHAFNRFSQKQAVISGVTLRI